MKSTDPFEIPASRKCSSEPGDNQYQQHLLLSQINPAHKRNSIMHETSAQGWSIGMTQRDGMGREVGGGIGMGNTCKSMADSCQCMAKTTTIL